MTNSTSTPARRVQAILMNRPATTDEDLAKFISDADLSGDLVSNVAAWITAPGDLQKERVAFEQLDRLYARAENSGKRSAVVGVARTGSIAVILLTLVLLVFTWWIR